MFNLNSIWHYNLIWNMSWIYSEGLSFLKREGGLYTKVCNQDQRILFKKKKINHVWLCSSKLFLVISVQALICIATLSCSWSSLATRTTSNSSCSVVCYRGGFLSIAIATYGSSAHTVESTSSVSPSVLSSFESSILTASIWKMVTSFCLSVFELLDS